MRNLGHNPTEMESVLFIFLSQSTDFILKQKLPI